MSAEPTGEPEAAAPAPVDPVGLAEPLGLVPVESAAPLALAEPIESVALAGSPATAPVPPLPDRVPVPLGRVALLLALLMVVAVVVALVVDAPGRYLVATVLALGADGLSVAAVVLGIVAAVRDRARLAAIAAVIVAILGNPLVLLYGLGAIS